jgi:hypothetical protein
MRANDLNRSFQKKLAGSAAPVFALLPSKTDGTVFDP